MYNLCSPTEASLTFTKQSVTYKRAKQHPNHQNSLLIQFHCSRHSKHFSMGLFSDSFSFGYQALQCPFFIHTSTTLFSLPSLCICVCLGLLVLVSPCSLSLGWPGARALSSLFPFFLKHQHCGKRFQCSNHDWKNLRQ